MFIKNNKQVELSSVVNFQINENNKFIIIDISCMIQRTNSGENPSFAFVSKLSTNYFRILLITDVSVEFFP